MVMAAERDKNSRRSIRPWAILVIQIKNALVDFPLLSHGRCSWCSRCVIAAPTIRKHTIENQRRLYVRTSGKTSWSVS